VPRTREEFGTMYIEKYRHDKELKLAVEQLEKKKNKMRQVKKKHNDHKDAISELQR
jgi:hypothetical protein